MTAVQVDPSPLYEQRLVILIEKAPQANRYEQVIITKDQFESIKPLLGDKLPDTFKTHDGKPIYNVQTDSRIDYVMPDSIKSHL